MRWVNIVALVAFGLFAAGSLFAAEAKGDTKAGKVTKADKASKAKWAVIQVGEDVRVVQEDKIKGIQDEQAKELKDAKKKNKKVDVKKFEVKVLEKNFATQKDAEKYRDDLEKKKNAKADKSVKGVKGATEKGTADKGTTGK